MRLVHSILVLYQPCTACIGCAWIVTILLPIDTKLNAQNFTLHNQTLIVGSVLEWMTQARLLQHESPKIGTYLSFHYIALY